ncbi:hypothetical protein TD95_002430 [Thielaviopsis punctulata]|uniref:Amino acid permease/ SLC12A domain-containing protein n=1 Tax=Thielaviopsis punctulata TaxID=72032 RepID=A0A0F4ZEB5_9PEZI|nr:hypothetical protein TD95_002430 [Thielaviopsis punctulata]
MSLRFSSASPLVHETASNSDGIVRDGELAFVRAQAGNGSKPSYQEAVGAPVESTSPLGYNVGWLTVIFLNVNRMIGTGIFSTPASILSDTGSVGLSLIYWAIGTITAAAGFFVYLELAAYFPNRSGSEVVYLEQAYPRPRHFFPIAFAVQSVLLSYSSSNAIVLSRYLWRIVGRSPSDWEMKGVAIAAYTAAVVCVVAHNKYSMWASNVFGVAKVITLIFISITGLVVLGGHVSKIPNPTANFHNAFEGTTTNGNRLASSLVNIVFSYSGWSNAFNVVNEIKDPVRTIRLNGLISLSLVSVLYMLCNIAYFASVPKETFSSSGQIAAAIFFSAVFGSQRAETALNVLVLCSAFGNLLVVLIGQSRMIREIGRQGVLPWTEFWVSTKPFGTPLGPYLLKWTTTFIMIVAPPAGDAFTFVVSLRTYPEAMFSLATAIGLYIVRRRQERVGQDISGFRAWHVAVVFYILQQVFLLAMPWWPPAGGVNKGSVSFFYATYCIVGIAVMLLCWVYYIMWIKYLPKWHGYAIRSEVVQVDDNGANSHRLVKVPLNEVAKWDEEHTEGGQLRRRTVPEEIVVVPKTSNDNQV